MTTQQRLEELEQQIEDLKNSLPAHSIPTAMLLTLEELEEVLDQLQKSTSGEIDAST
jgi:hypothetical protein